jgi:hypothetical protein
VQLERGRSPSGWFRRLSPSLKWLTRVPTA